MGLWQFLHLPPSTRNESRGILSYQFMVAPQVGQWDLPEINNSLLGRRFVTTPRKEPNANPIIKIRISSKDTYCGKQTTQEVVKSA